MCYHGNMPVFETGQEMRFVESRSEKCLMYFGTLALIYGQDISTAQPASVPANQLALGQSSFPRTTILLSFQQPTTQHSSITSSRAGL